LRSYNLRCAVLTILGTVLLSALFAMVSSAMACSGPHMSSIQDGFRYGFPPNVEKNGLQFATQNISLHRHDVRYRILKELNYLLQDRRSKVLVWLTKADALRPVMSPILHKYKVPAEFVYLAAIESSYNGRALSSAGAYGYWQFIKSTASCGPSGCDEYDWKMSITNWKDDRGDLVLSTHSAAKYLAWINRVKKVCLDEKKEKEGFQDWLLTAAAYNAGPARVTQRMNSFKADSYWDAPLPIETERYVPRWIAVWMIHRYRDFYGLQIPPVKGVSFDTIQKVQLEKDLSIAAMAKLLNSTPRDIWTLNTQVSPEKAMFPARAGRAHISHTIHVPKGTRQKFLAQLAAHGYTKTKPVQTSAKH
jgi:membrane-bound lytic murein transglycosylase D